MSNQALINIYIFSDTTPFAGETSRKIEPLSAYKYHKISCKNVPPSTPPYKISWVKTTFDQTGKPTETEVENSDRIVVDPQGLYNEDCLFSWPEQSPGRAIVLPPVSALALAAASALAKCSSFYVKVFYVIGKELSGELSCPCGRSCLPNSDNAPDKGNRNNLRIIRAPDKRGIEDNSDIFSYFSLKAYVVTPHRDDSNDGSQNMFLWRYLFFRL